MILAGCSKWTVWHLRLLLSRTVQWDRGSSRGGAAFRMNPLPRWLAPRDVTSFAFSVIYQGSSSTPSNNGAQGATSRQQVPPPASVSPQQGTPKMINAVKMSSLMGEAPISNNSQGLQIETHEVHNAATAPLSKCRRLGCGVLSLFVHCVVIYIGG